MEENMKALGQTVETLNEHMNIDEEIAQVTDGIKKYKCYSIAVWVLCAITFVVKFIIW